MTEELALELMRKYKRYHKMLSKYENTSNPNSVFNFYGGVEYGRLKGKMQLIEDLLDMYDITYTDRLIEECNTKN